LVTSVLRRERPPATGRGQRPRVLIIIQNLSVPFDRRVWLECQSLKRAGYHVTVVCPAGDGSVPHTVLDGIEIYTYRGYSPGGRAIGFVAEYAYSFAATARLVMKARRRGGPFDVMQACNPPDIFWPLAEALRRRDGTRFVFDHHDLCPELYRSRFGNSTSPAYRGLLFLERMTFRTADRVTSTNESYADVARRRGGKPAEDVTVVRTGPDPEKLKAGPPDPTLRHGRRHLVAYIGVMGPQDGVDLAVRAAGRIVHDLGRRDVSFVFMGSGDCHPDLVALRDELDLGDYLDLPGRVPDEFVHRVLSTADVCLSPDPMNPLNDVSTMNKTMEYMAYGLPVVAFDLHETRVSAGPAAVYVEPNDVDRFARAVVDLLDQPDVRSEMGRLGRKRVVEELAWEHQEGGYVDVFDDLTRVLSERGR
jgi:glycosyltransferase involved in cell wall biosynthesis